MTHPTDPRVEVTDADKHAAEAFWMTYGPFAWGTVATLYEAFARHRTSTQAMTERIEDMPSVTQEFFDMAREAIPALTTAQNEAADLRQWRDALDGALTNYGRTAEEFPDARAAVQWLIQQEHRVALDPAVSKDAADLRAEVERKDAKVAEVRDALRFLLDGRAGAREHAKATLAMLDRAALTERTA